jgi:hypothetical protein
MSITIGSGVTNFGSYAFAYCSGLTAMYFTGNMPAADSTVFYGSPNVTVYFLPGTDGWGPTFGGDPTAPRFLPQPLILGANISAQTGGFGFTLSWATNASVVVEACANLSNPVWRPVQTNSLAGGTACFIDPQWTNYPGRFYRLRLP